MDVNLIGSGPNANIESQIDPTFQAIRTSIRPLEYAGQGLIGGHFMMAATFSNTAGGPTAGQQLFSMRWTDSRFLYILHRVIASLATTTAFGTAQAVDLDIIAARSYSTNPTGGTAITLATNAQRARSNMMGGSLLASSGNLQISSGAGLTAGSLTLDTQPFGYLAALSSSAVGTVGTGDLYNTRDFGQHPMIFGANEGYVIRNGIAFGATGVVKIGFTFFWAEVPLF